MSRVRDKENYTLSESIRVVLRSQKSEPVVVRVKEILHQSLNVEVTATSHPAINSPPSIISRETLRRAWWKHLEKLIPDALQVSGSLPDEAKEERYQAFASGRLRVLVVKPSMAAFGLNWQHCGDMTFFPSHSFEQYYQGVRRCWRFGRTKPVDVTIVTTEGEQRVMRNLQHKAEQADEMFTRLVVEMNNGMNIERSPTAKGSVEVPAWLM